ncbi:hypothetical protein P6P90_06680 [Ectobacillus antri]|uniref:DUF2969 domain-containing protein n=1 Tax=Ectobacillus antri TaxID=2486280 RepID=A0ABT6H2N8_9BACI|nr:hypothetical protein [Ectobacillus antri]MDG4658099.1 hypothetical protein [Ectobacillus antri]MDG5753660.1 hypothetical protein [Ectobacillus antri]
MKITNMERMLVNIEGVEAYKLATGKYLVVDNSEENAKLLEFESGREYGAHILIRRIDAGKSVCGSD